jgi:tetratricopeptide (TPR) repeat protein
MPQRVSSQPIQKLSVAIFTTGAFCLLLVAAATADVVRLLPGATIKAPGNQLQGQITSESPTEVKIKTAVGGEQSVPVDQIDTITYDGAPPSYALAESRANSGALAEAADLYQKAVGEAQSKPTLERAAQFGRAEALAELALVDPGKADDAITALDGVVKSGPNSRQLGPALLLLVRVHMSRGDTAKAEAALTELNSRVPWASNRTAVLRARLMGKKGDHDAALKALDGIVATAPKGSAQAREALLAKADSLAATKKFAEAEAAVRDVIEQANPEDVAVQAEAYNTLGDCLRSAGKPKEALLAYLRTDILYSSAKDEHARALAQIVELWRELKQDARAIEKLEELKQQYPNSPYLTGKKR